MALIQSGAGPSLQTIDATSLAGHVTEYDTGGNPFWNTAKSGSYCGRWSSGILAANLAALAPIAALYNGASSTKSVDITRILVDFSVSVAFTAGANNLEIVMQRFSVAAMAGGAAYNVVKLRTAYPQSQITTAGDLRASTTAALTTAGVTLATDYIPIGCNLGQGAVSSSSAQCTVDFTGPRSDLLRLAPGEGLALMNLVIWPLAGTASVAASVWWDER